MMAVPKKKVRDIETRVRHSYFRAKLRNDHELTLLRQRLGHLHYQTVSTLEGHWRNTMDVVEIFKGCQRTSGLSPVGIRPTKRDTRETLLDLHSKTVPWAHFSRYSIDSWHRYDEDGVYYGRPKTAHERRAKSTDPGLCQRERPSTAHPLIQVSECQITNIEDPEQDNTKEDNKEGHNDPGQDHLQVDSVQQEDESSFVPRGVSRTVSSADYRKIQMAQLRAKTATMTRKKFIDLNSTGPMYNRNVASACRTMSHVENPEYVESLEDDDGDYLEVRELDAWDLNTLRQQYNKDDPDKSPRPRSKTPAASDKSPDVSKSAKKLVTNTGMDSGGSKPNSHELDLPQRKMSKALSYCRSVSSDVQSVAVPRTESNMDQLQPHPKENDRPSQPKFYVRPQDRHNMNQSFLMKRYFFLQRQMNKNHGIEADALAKVGSVLVVNPTLSRSARLKVLHSLTDEYDKMQRRRLGPDSQELLRTKVADFIRRVTEFIEDTREDETRAWEDRQRQRKLEDQRRKQQPKSRKQLR